MFLNSVMTLLKGKAWTPQNSQFWYSLVVMKRYTSNSSKKLYLFCSCSIHFIDIALRKYRWKIILFSKVFDRRNQKCSFVWVNFIQSYFSVREILLRYLTKKKKKKIGVNFIHSYDIHCNSQPTTINALNNLIRCYSDFTSILELTYQNKLWCDPFQREKQKIKFKIL